MREEINMPDHDSTENFAGQGPGMAQPKDNGGKVQMGWAAPLISEQFPQIPVAEANRLQKDSDSITHLSMRGIITPSEKKKALMRFASKVSGALKDARVAARKGTAQ